MTFWYGLTWILLQPFVKLYFRLTVKRWQKVPSSGAVLLASNHASYLDPFVIGTGLRRQVAFLAREELFKIPLFGRYIRLWSAYPVARKSGDIRAIRTVLNLMKEERALVVFPEGSRSVDGLLKPVEQGIAWMALKSGATIVPLYIKGSWKSFPRGGWLPKPYRVTIYVGDPIDPKTVEAVEEKEKQIETLTGKIYQALQELEEEAHGGKK